MLDTSYFEAVEQIDWSAQGTIYAFGYYGGKLSHLSRILPLLPRCTTYVEPFAGSAAVLLNRLPSPVEVYNDLDGDIVNFFKVLREQPDELERQLRLTPFSRLEYVQSCTRREDVTDIERARQFYVRHNQSFANIPRATPGRWGYCITHSRRGMSGIVSSWHSNLDMLDIVAQRLLQVQIECAPAIEVIQRYDTPETLFYVDPPYPHEIREQSSLAAYWHEMTDEQHRKLATVLKACKGRVAISGYECELYTELFGDWHKHVFKSSHIFAGNAKDKRVTQEVVWTNYDPVKVYAETISELPLFAGLTA